MCTSSIKGDSFNSWDEEAELSIVVPVREPLPKPETK